MSTVFVVLHARSGETGAEDVKFIGVYSDASNAKSAVSRLKKQEDLVIIRMVL